MIRLLTLLAVATLGALSAVAQPVRTVAVTLDDLPYVGGSIEEAKWATESLLGALAQYDAPADVFVTGGRVEVEGEAGARRALLRRWLAEGHALHNHSYSHHHYSAVEPAVYLADVARGHALITAVLEEADTEQDARFFRAPYNDLGESAATRSALATALGERGVRLAPFTVEHADYAFNALYRDALSRGDSTEAARIGQAYLAQLDAAFTFAEHLAHDTFGRAIPQVFLVHANRINAEYLGTMLGSLRERGYTFVTLDEAVSDPAYATTDAYERKWGVSWLHRWRVGLGLPNAQRDEPALPPWVLLAYRALGD